MRSVHALALLATAALVLGLAAPAAAGGLPSLDLKRGQGSVGIGAISVGGDVAVQDGLSVGLFGYNALLYYNMLTARTTWTGWTGPHGSFGVTGTGGAALIVGSYPGARVASLLVAGPVYESPPYWVRLRAYLQGGLFVLPNEVYDTGAYPIWSGEPNGAPVLLGTRTDYNVAVLPGIEVVVPLGANAELTFLGNGLIGLYGRW